MLATGCGPAPVETTDTTEQEDPTVTGYATDVITHVHKKGDDPCPQEVVQEIEVFCFKDNTFATCDANSVVITGSSPGLNIKFPNGMQSRTVDDVSVLTASLEFTCQIAESFTHTYTLVFYKDGVEVDREDVKVDVTVN
ncbi:MAG: hypothetical protein ACI8SE_001692 [Bacteroidia bacterium]|jgi:hypothetical protein